ncbi:unnamed protein product [Discosporangium mesarthrocarpum]
MSFQEKEVKREHLLEHYLVVPIRLNPERVCCKHCASTFSGTTARMAAHIARRTGEYTKVCTNPSAGASEVGKNFWEVKLKALNKEECRAKEMPFRQDHTPDGWHQCQRTGKQGIRSLVIFNWSILWRRGGLHVFAYDGLRHTGLVKQFTLEATYPQDCEFYLV